jgi:hypothetical protein
MPFVPQYLGLKPGRRSNRKSDQKHRKRRGGKWIGKSKGFRRKFETTPYRDFGGSSYMSLSGSDSRSLSSKVEYCGLQPLRVHEKTQTMS